MRPLRFTPARTDAIQPLAADQPTRATPSATVRATAWVAIALGWSVFIAWWAIVLRRESARSLGVALAVLATIVIASAVGMSLWTRHNIRLAKKGKRGRSSLYIPMVWERDTLGRSLELPSPEIVRSAAEVRVVLNGGVKAYVVADPEEL